MTDDSSGSGADAPTPDETDYRIGQDNITPFGLDIHNPVFLVSGLSIAAFVIITLMFQESATGFFGWLRPTLTSVFDWFFLSAANVFVLFCVMLLVTPLGKVRLGDADAKPDYSYMGWFVMLFAAGMGIGLMFFGVSEPMSHFESSLGGAVIEGGVRTDWAPLGAAAGDIDAARKLGLTRARMTQISNLLLLSLNIQEQVLLGRLRISERDLRAPCQKPCWADQGIE